MCLRIATLSEESIELNVYVWEKRQKDGAGYAGFVKCFFVMINEAHM